MTSAYEYYWTAGYYEEVPTGPGVFFITAAKEGYLPASYPESIRLNTNARMPDIDIALYPVGLAEDAVDAGHAIPSISWHKGQLLIVSDRAGTVRVRLINEAGNLMWNRVIDLEPGVNHVGSFRGPSGVYFASCLLRDRTLRTKFVLY